MPSELSGFKYPRLLTQLVPLLYSGIFADSSFQTARGKAYRPTAPEGLDEVPPPENVSCQANFVVFFQLTAL
jgi:hypothetical protein